MSDRSTADRAARRMGRSLRLPPDAFCTFCGEARSEALEVHHPLGRAHDPTFTLVICRNCHAVHHEDLRTAGVVLSAPTTPRASHRAQLLAVGVLLKNTAEALDRVTRELLGDEELR